jgi:hypothetical protein
MIQLIKAKPWEKKERWMKTKKASLIISALGLMAFFTIMISPAHAYSILVHGRENCGFTQAMRQNLNSANYRYTYYDIDRNEAAFDQMWDKIRKVDPLSTSVKLPVMDLNGQIFMRPTFEEVKQKIGPP